MAELGATEDPAVLVPGDPGALRSAAESYRQHARTLGDAADGLGRLATPQGWNGAAADGFRASFDVQPQRWQDAAAAFTDAARTVDNHASALEFARGRAGEAAARWREAQSASATARVEYDRAAAAGPTATPFVDPGESGRADAQAMLSEARRHVRDSGDRSVAVIAAACAAAPATPGWWGRLVDGESAVASETGNAIASVGNALLDHPADVAAMVGGGALTVVSAVGVAGSMALDATGAGALGGVPLGAASVAGVAAGVGIAGAGALDIAQHALTDDRVAPFTVAADADPGEDVPLPAADRITSIGVPGRRDRVRELPDERAVQHLYDELAEDGSPVQWDGYPGQSVRLPDGTEIGLRQSSRHVTTIDVRLPNGEQWKVHIPQS